MSIPMARASQARPGDSGLFPWDQVDSVGICLGFVLSQTDSPLRMSIDTIPGFTYAEAIQPLTDHLHPLHDLAFVLLWVSSHVNDKPRIDPSYE